MMPILLQIAFFPIVTLVGIVLVELYQLIKAAWVNW